ncbi:MAG: hypothetical protein K8M05_05420 [Deltaproteobacteria bacterium]|nr:hypothetical protein [Kofleriaceae bacterium]
MRRSDGLIVPDDDPDAGGLGAVAALIAVIAVGIGIARWWFELSQTWAWLSLGTGAFACGIALLRLVHGRLRDFGGILGALGSLVLGGAAIAGWFSSIAPLVGVGLYLASWLVIGYFE